MISGTMLIVPAILGREAAAAFQGVGSGGAMRTVSDVNIVARQTATAELIATFKALAAAVPSREGPKVATTSSWTKGVVSSSNLELTAASRWSLLVRNKPTRARTVLW